MKKYRGWVVEVVPNGFIVTIGCTKVVAETAEKLSALTARYLNDPNKAEKELNENSIKYDMPTPDMPTPVPVADDPLMEGRYTASQMGNGILGSLGSTLGGAFRST